MNLKISAGVAAWILPLLLFVLTFLNGCYYTKQGRYLLSHQMKADPVEKLLENRGLDEKTRDFLLLVEDIRRFSREELGLKDNDNYTTFLDTGGEVLAWVVSASDPLAFDTHLWKYPFLGKMPYKGFYEAEDAEKEREKLAGKGLDVWIRGVGAFSTLGFFKDPLYGYMTGYPVHRLANLIIHEQTHATVWRKDDTAFNEDLASFVGDEGARLYVLSRYGENSPEYRAIGEGESDYRLFIEDIFALRDELQILYDRFSEGTMDEETALDGKERIIAGFKSEFLESYDERYGGNGFSGFADLPVNNAYLELFQLYEGNREWFERKYAEAGYDMKVFIASL